MFTRNMVSIMTITSAATTKVFKTTAGVMANRNGHSNIVSSTTSSGQLTYHENEVTSSSDQWSAFGIVLGTGTTAPTINDYKMESYIPSSTLSYVGSTITLPITATEWANAGALSLTQTVANNTENPVTVTELGVYNGRTSSATGYCALLTRDVISPVTIQPNETKTFIISWDLADILNGGTTTVTQG